MMDYKTHLGRTATLRGPLGVDLDQLKATLFDGLLVQLAVQVLHPSVQESVQFVNSGMYEISVG